jgi:hypothetical protein
LPLHLPLALTCEMIPADNVPFGVQAPTFTQAFCDYFGDPVAFNAFRRHAV